MFELLKKVLAPIGPSGRETPVANAIRSEIEGHVDTIETDAMGNLIATKLGKGEHPRKIMFSAHMDHIGFVVTGYEKEGFLRVTNVGGLSAGSCGNVRHVIFENGVEGVLALEPVKDAPTMNNLFVDIGAESKEEAMTRVQLGDMAVFAPDVVRLGEHRVASPAMDDRCACALLIKLLQTLGDTKDTVIAVFSVQEEVGCRGAVAASFAKEPDIGIAIDVTGNGDTPETKLPSVRLGDGIAVKVMDRASISNPALRDELLQCGVKAGVKTQREVLPYGGTDACSMQLSRGGIPVCTLSIPCRNVHSACEVIDLRDMEAGLQVMLAYLQ